MKTLWIENSNASTAEIEAGVRAALECLSGAGFTVDRAAAASVGDVADDEAVEAWDRAELAAFRAAFDGWAQWPEAAVLVAE